MLVRVFVLVSKERQGWFAEKYGPSLVIVGRLFYAETPVIQPGKKQILLPNTRRQEREETYESVQKIMNGVAFVEKLILVLSTILIVVLTVGNVLSRKILHQSWSFTEELVVAVFVLITLLAAALAARDGELVNLSLLPDRLSAKARRILLVVNTVFSVAFTVVLFKYGMDKVLTQLANGKRTFVLNWPEWIFWSFVPIGAACMTLHMIEYLIDTFVKAKEEGQKK